MAALMPLPGSRVIHSQWETHHQPVVEGTFTARIRLRHATEDSETPNPATGVPTVVKATPYYDGPCRIQQLHQPQSGETAGQVESTHDYLVQVPKAVTGARVLDVGEVYQSGDASLNGRDLEVSDVTRGSLTWSTDLVCLDNLGR